VSDKLFRILCVVLAPFILGAAANYYLDLGWFGTRSKVVLSITLLATCILLLLSRRTVRKGG
jgi:predicted Na+-dependent transporter